MKNIQSLLVEFLNGDVTLTSEPVIIQGTEITTVAYNAYDNDREYQTTIIATISNVSNYVEVQMDIKGLRSIGGFEL